MRLGEKAFLEKSRGFVNYMLNAVKVLQLAMDLGCCGFVCMKLSLVLLT